jgi:hypothetical protein
MQHKIKNVTNFHFLCAVSVLAWTNLSQHDETWAEFLTLDMDVLVYALDYKNSLT